MASETLISRESHTERGQFPPVCYKSTGGVRAGAAAGRSRCHRAEIEAYGVERRCHWGEHEFPKAVYPVPGHRSTTEFLLVAGKGASLGGCGGVASEST